jgi:hypothetical protein
VLAALHVGAGDLPEAWLSTKAAFDWSPNAPGEWIQVTFDLVADRANDATKPAQRFGYFIAAHDFDDSGPADGGNVLIDGNPGGPTTVYLDYPGKDGRAAGSIGKTGYAPGRNYGVRLTNVGDGRLRLEHLVDWTPEGASLELTERDLPEGGFAFYFGHGRSFVVDNVCVEKGPTSATGRPAGEPSRFPAALAERRKELARTLAGIDAQRQERPGRKIAAVWDVSAAPPDVYVLRRGEYGDRGAKVEPRPPALLCDENEPFQPVAPAGLPSTGRRLALAEWLTRPGSRAAALWARVQVNRIWQGHFGRGIAATADNLGYSGSPPTHPELLDRLAVELGRGGMSAKSLHRRILRSAAYRRSSRAHPTGLSRDPNNLYLWRFPLRRLEAEAIRDGMLAVSGELDLARGGPYVPTRQTPVGEVVVDEASAGARRRSVYLQQRRSQTLSLLATFDAPAMAFVCTSRSDSAIPLQSLAQLNSEFALARARGMAARVLAEGGPDDKERIARAFVLALGRPPSATERDAAESFLRKQQRIHAAADDPMRDPHRHAWADFCQTLLAANAFLYIE